jgi:AcrR family transcriptional regulator
VTWRALGRFHALIALNSRQSSVELRRRHEAVLAVLEPLIARGRRDGTFRADVPVQWHLSMILALVHAASAELREGRVPADRVEAAVVATVLGALRRP